MQNVKCNYVLFLPKKALDKTGLGESLIMAMHTVPNFMQHF